MYRKETGTFTSSNGVNQIKYYVYIPDEVKAKIQLIHGMCEYLERYEPFIDFLTDKGYLVYGCDHLGHKGSVESDDQLGYFAPNDGWKCLVKDQKLLMDEIEERYADVPVFIYGHSMGSFVARAFAVKYAGTFKGAVFCGSAGFNKSLAAGQKVIKLVKFLRGGKSRSAFIAGLMFGSYNKQYENPRTPYDWLTRDEEVVDAYIADPYCGFTFTTSGYYDLTCLLDFVTSDSWYEKLNADIPVLFVAGTADPVGDWGNGMADVNTRMKNKERADYTMKLYKNYRHELHNEVGREKFFEDIVSWLDERV
ncbi:MAG: alpha/beta hydrolase [Eubacterium sp.]|nr:alpha/beta hydrolase [Eubacterium sp.]